MQETTTKLENYQKCQDYGLKYEFPSLQNTLWKLCFRIARYPPVSTNFFTKLSFECPIDTPTSSLGIIWT